ncbi:hypothetical protein PIB30_067917 [Stylosanthes scabra]|uniref:Uncharacterized protein n=1 Tax=Stylosanthes scabra TaxID=79078 RepID=A0ABU6QPV8_9FABA|nr:hypothetical protein [Stylosanthes scabra]
MTGAVSPLKDHVRGTGQPRKAIRPTPLLAQWQFLDLTRIVPVTVGYSWEPGAQSRTPSNTCSKWGSLSSKFTKGLSKQVMESYYSCNQGYAPWNPTPYQSHDLGYDVYQSYGFGDTYYGYEDPSPPYPPSQKGIEEVIQLLCQERKEIREILEQIANQVDTLCSIVIQWKTQSAIKNSSRTFQHLNSEDRPSKSLPNPRGCIC